jgi:hypothetical protein
MTWQEKVNYVAHGRAKLVAYGIWLIADGGEQELIANANSI